MVAGRIGAWAALGLFLNGTAYLVVLVIGIASYGWRPIADPVLAIMEALTLVAAPAVVVLMAAVQAFVLAERRVYGQLALAFSTVFAGLTSAVHFVELTATRQRGSAGILWPSPAYAIELLAWNLFLGLALLFAGAALAAIAPSAVRRGLLLAGGLCVAGTLGPVVGNMRLQLVGVFGYAVVLPVVCLLLARFFRAAGEAESRLLTTEGGKR
jgi:uncharacterized membrane protein